MKLIAFKRAGKDHKTLHPDFIVEWIDASLAPTLEGYLTTTEDLFNDDLAKNDGRHSEWLAKLKKDQEAAQAAQVAEEVHEKRQEREQEREYARFKAWKKSQQK